MLQNIKTTWTALLVVGVAIGVIITATVGHYAQAQEQARDNVPLGRIPAANSNTVTKAKPLRCRDG